MLIYVIRSGEMSLKSHFGKRLLGSGVEMNIFLISLF